MDHILLISILFFCFSMPKLHAQQNYSGNSVMDCNGDDETGPSPAFLYTCNGNNRPCQGFLIFKSQHPYDTVSSISNLTSSDPTELARVNNISNSAAALPPDKEVIVPISCYCSGVYYQANTSFIIPTIHDTYFSIANNTYQGLSTCNILKHENNYSETSLDQGLTLRVPLRCACPTSNQIVNGTEFLLTYLVSWGDSVPDISKRFNVSIESIVNANGFTEDDPLLFPFTTILIPLKTEPLSSQTIIHYPPPPSPPIVPTRKYNQTSSRGIYLWVGIGIGISLLVLCFVLSIVLFHHKRRRDEAARKDGKREKKRNLPEDFLVSVSNLDRGLKFYKYEDLVVATENFSPKNMIDGSVFRGILNGSTVAIKCMRRSISKEVNLLKKINHFNLINLFGACEHDGVFYLVYEFMENGSLSDWLHKKRYPEFVSWNCRFRIALDVAHGLHYLHNCTDPGYVHKDISSGNILLDKNLRAKLANFSFVRSAVREESGYSSTKTAVGTNGYMAPEYMEYGLVTPEMDTYAFGVVLLELITGKEAAYKQDGEEILLAEAVFSMVEGGNAEAKLSVLVDPNLQANKKEIAHHLIMLCLACIAREPESRPSMAEVVSTLMKIQLDVQRSQTLLLERI